MLLVFSCFNCLKYDALQYYLRDRHTHTHPAVLWPFVRDYPGGQVPEETFTRSHLWESVIIVDFM